MPSKTTTKGAETTKPRKATRSTPAPEQPGTLASAIEAEGGNVTVQGVEVDAAGSIPTGIPLPDGSVFMVVEPGQLVHDPDVDPGREPEDYDPKNKRIQELAASMKAFAARNPLGIGNDSSLVCRRAESGQLLIVEGRRRHAAAGVAGTKLAIVVRKMTTKEARIAANVENEQRETASVLCVARQFRDLREKDGLKVEEIAAAVGKEQPYVSKRLALLTLPAWVQAKLSSGELTVGTAYEGMARFVRVPEPAATKMWEALRVRWDELEGRGITAERISNMLGDIARHNSRPLDPATSYPGEEVPMFDLAAHDAVCTCKRPKIRLLASAKEHARCYDVAKWNDLQQDAKAERRKALQTSKTNGNGETEPQPQPLPAPVQPRTVGTPAAYTAPTWSDVTATFGGRAADWILADERALGDLHNATPVKLLDVNQLSPDVVQWVLSPYNGGNFRLICTDAAAIDRAVKGGGKLLRERAERVRQQDEAAFREAASALDYRSADVMAALAFNYGEPARGFVTETGKKLGLEVAGLNVDEFAKLQKKELALLLQGMAYRVQRGDFYSSDTSTERARGEVMAEATDDLRALIAAVPVPELTPAGRLLTLAARVEAGRQGAAGLVKWHDETEPAARADELGENARTWAEIVALFRREAAALAAEAEASGLDVDAIGNPEGPGSLADLIAGAAELLTHPVLALVEAEAARQAEASGSEQAREAGEQPVDGSGEGASAPAPAAGEQLVDAGDFGDDVGGAEAPNAPAPTPASPQAEPRKGRRSRKEG